jgi:hypothetical protein
MTFLLEMDTTYFSHWFALSKVIFHLEFGSTSLDDWPFNIFFAISLLTLPLMIITNKTTFDQVWKTMNTTRGTIEKEINT